MGTKKIKDMVALLTKAERAEMEATVVVEYAKDMEIGDRYAKENPKQYKDNLRESIASELILGRKDGTVVTYRDGSRRAQLGNLEVEQDMADRMDPDSRALTYDFTSIKQVHRIGGPSTLIARGDGTIVGTSNPVKVNCGVAVAVENAVDKAFRNGKLDPQEADELRAQVTAPHPLRRDGQSCNKGQKI